MEINIKHLEEVFEPELINEIIESNIETYGKSGKLINQGSNIEAIPLVLKGSIRIVKIDKKGDEILIYNINKHESCILGLTSCMATREKKANIRAIANEDTEILTISPGKVKLWLDKYPSWRTFLVNLYNQRLGELLMQHDKIKLQRDEIFTQKQDITDSIEYASRIQTALMTSEDEIKNILPNYFIFNKPRDIVSGDYYWITKIGGKSIVAVADCTGHGVPGAFMSMLGMSFLNEIVSRNKLIKANEILNKMRSNIKSALKQEGRENEARDGIDMALCVIDFENKKLEFAGAYNPLIIVRDNQLFQLKADRMPVGIHVKEKETFTNHEIDIQKNDLLYMFSDGFIDQFGGPENRKYMSKNFKKLLVSIHKEPMDKQLQILEETLNTWRGEREQVDDILVVGIKI